MVLSERAGRWFERRGWGLSPGIVVSTPSDVQVRRWFERHGSAFLRHLVFVWVLLVLAEQALEAGMAADPWSMAASQLCTLFTGIVGKGLAVVAVVYGGLSYAFGEGAKSALAAIIFGVGMVLLAPQLLVYFFGGTAITC